MENLQFIRIEVAEGWICFQHKYHTSWSGIGMALDETLDLINLNMSDCITMITFNLLNENGQLLKSVEIY